MGGGAGNIRMLPSFLPCLWSCSVCYTHFPSAPTEGPESEDKTFDRLKSPRPPTSRLSLVFRHFSAIFSVTDPRPLSPSLSYHATVLSPLPLFLSSRLPRSAEDKATPIHWEPNGLNGDGYHRQPFLPELPLLSLASTLSLSSLFWGGDCCSLHIFSYAPC